MPEDIQLTNHEENKETTTTDHSNYYTALALVLFIVVASYAIGVANG